MDLKTIHTHLANQWIRINGISDEIKKRLTDFEGENLFGYIYIDHTAGVTLEVVRLFDIVNDEIMWKGSPIEKNIRVISRLDGIIRSKEVHILSDELIKEYQLEVPEYISSYEEPILQEFRFDERFHQFRGDGFPDDVQILLPPTHGLRPELIWGRVEKYENNILECQILKQPYQDFGIHLNDIVYA